MQNEENEPIDSASDFIHPRNHDAVLNILTKAGWIKGGASSYSETPGNYHSKIRVDPTEAGAERFRAILLLLRELDAIERQLNPHEAALVCRLARKFAPDQDNLEWPSELPFTRE
jgi:secreted Zn-dependent insulinase-like peptidase